MPVPAPLAATGEVLVDPFARTLNVRPAEMSGYAAVWWRQAHRELVEDEKFRRFGYSTAWCACAYP